MSLSAPPQGVFSAHAEVVPVYKPSVISSAGILRARGGSSDWDTAWHAGNAYSPRTRR